MSLLLVCPKSKGNTFKVCNYVANNSAAELLVINQNQINDLKKYTSIILCSGVYGGVVHKNLQKWLNQIEKTSIREDTKIYVFLTWFGRGQSDKDAIKGVKTILKEKKISLENDYITCYGQGMWFIRHGHPNKEDCEKVLNWVKSKI